MTMRRLWRGLKYPAYDHPLFWRVQSNIYGDSTRFVRILQNIFLQGQIWLWPLLFIVDMRLVCLMVLSGSISGVLLSLRISSQITSEQRSRTYDLLCLTPGGTIRALWAICSGCLHRDQAFEILNSHEAWIVRLGLFVPFIVSSQLLLERLFGFKNGLTLLWGIGFIALYAVDHVQATVFGCVAGMLAGQTPLHIDKRLWAVTAFASFQIGTYLFTAIASLVLFPDLYRVVEAFGIPADVSQMIFTVGVFYAIRERIIMLGWRHLLNVTNAATSEIDFLTLSPSYLRRNLHDDTHTVARA